MDPLEDLLRAARHAPPATAARLEEARRRGRRRSLATRAVVASGGAAMVASLALAVTTIGGDRAGVVAPAATSSSAATAGPTSEPDLEAMAVVGRIAFVDAALDADGRTLTVRYSARAPKDAQGSCQVRVRVRTEETAEAVTVTLEHVAPPDEPSRPSNEVCLSRLYERTDTVTLKQPLGDRILRDGTSGVERAVRR